MRTFPSTRAHARILVPLVPLVFAAVAQARDDVSDAARVSQVLARARRAIGWEHLAPAGSAVRVRGAARFLGTDAEQTILFDGQGRFWQSFEGDLVQQSGLDGDTAWVVDWTGTSRVLELGERANAEVSAWLLSGAWAAPEGALAFSPAADSAEGELALDFVHADGVLTGRLQLDAQTGLLRAARFGSGEGASWTFSDYREHDGLRFPQRVVIEQRETVQSLDTRSVELLADVPAERFATRLAPPGDTRFDPDVAPTLEVRRVSTGHLLVHPSVDGEDLGWFILDSGAGVNCIALHVADRLPEGPFGEILARGVGGTVPAHFWRAGKLQLGPLTVASPIFMELDLAFLEQHFGVPVGGILGFELFARCALELDMRAGTVALYDPATYALPEAGRWEQAVLYGRHPGVRATVEGRAGLFKIDTGAADDTLTMHYHAVLELGLLEGRETRASAAGGVGGHVPTRDGELASFELGGRRFAPLAAAFAVEDKGAFSDAYVWGNIGGELLEPFLLVFDYPGRRLGFVPRAE